MPHLRLSLLLTSALVLGTVDARAVELSCSVPPRSDERLNVMTDDGIGLTSELGLPDGRYALPATTAPTQLVVMFHGHGNDSCSWRKHLQDAAARGAVALAMDYVDRRPGVENYGWFMRRAAADSIEAARYFLAAYPSITTVFAIGISMGGNASGLAMASQATRLDGTTPLFDYWVDVEGVNNLTEEYAVARALAPGLADAALAQQEIEEENGGTLEEVPDRYAELTNVARAPEMSALQGAVVVNGVDDGLVTTDQSPQMAAALNAVGVPTHRYTVLLHGEGEPGSTISCIPFSAAGLPCPTIFAGHGWEGSDTQLVIKTGFVQLWALMDGAQVVPGETVLDVQNAPEPGRFALFAAGWLALLGLERRRRQR
jgi:pimeloyl-ACP methyl ester carboxylesterase